jgi:hypothetical protein
VLRPCATSGDLYREREDGEHPTQHGAAEDDVVGVEVIGVAAEVLPRDEDWQIEGGEGREAAQRVVDD